MKPIPESLRQRAVASGTSARRAQEVPGAQGDVARQIYQALTTRIPPESLSFGGGTVLAARWRHRKSLDVDLWCRPDAWTALDATAQLELQQQIWNIPGCNQDLTSLDPSGLTTEIGGVEATLGPVPDGPGARLERELAGTRLRLQTNEEILYGKIFHRMLQQQAILVRDVYDLASAAIYDPEALARTRQHVGPALTGLLATTLGRLPAGWSRRDRKPVLEPTHTWNESRTTTAAIGALLGSASGERGHAR